MGHFDEFTPETDNVFADLSPEQPPTTKTEEVAGTLRNVPFSVAGQFGEGVASMAGNIGTMAASGLAGLNQYAVEARKAISPNFEADWTAPAQAVDAVQAKGQELFAPETPGGQAVVEGTAKGIEAAGTAIKYPLSAIPFMVSGSDERQEFMDMPIGDYLGELAQDSGASPLLATLAHLAPDVAMSVAGGGAASKIAKAKPRPKPPSIDELKAQSAKLYDVVDNAGIAISDVATTDALRKIIDYATNRGMRKKLTPKTHAALVEVEKDILGGTLTLKKAEELRRVIKQAQAATDTADAAMAGRVLKKWDDFIENLNPSQLSGAQGKETIQYLKSARGLWSRARKTEQIEEMIENARIAVGANYTQAGFETALRQKFRALATNNKKMRMFTAQERAAIKKVAMGAPLQNFARLIGKAAPTGMISGAMGSGAGYMMMGPGGAFLVPAVGGIARKAATSATFRNAKQASEVMRRGPQ